MCCNINMISPNTGRVSRIPIKHSNTTVISRSNSDNRIINKEVNSRIRLNPTFVTYRSNKPSSFIIFPIPSSVNRSTRSQASNIQNSSNIKINSRQFSRFIESLRNTRNQTPMSLRVTTNNVILTFPKPRTSIVRSRRKRMTSVMLRNIINSRSNSNYISNFIRNIILNRNNIASSKVTIIRRLNRNHLKTSHHINCLHSP